MTARRITQSQADEIRALIGGGANRKDVAKRFGVCLSTVSHICTGRYYAAAPQLRMWTLSELLDNTSPEPTTGCFLWLGALGVDGYGNVRHNGKNKLAHRLVYSFASAEPDAAMVVRHRCDQRTCVNPAHLEIGTHQDNTLDRERRKRSMRFTKPHRQASLARHGMAKIGIYQAFLAREMWLTGQFSQRRIAAEIGVSQTHVSDIVNDKTKWSQLWNGGSK